MSNVVVYNDGKLELKVSLNDESIWLNQLQMSELFETSTDNIGLHLKNIYKEKELEENSTTEDFSVVRQEGNRQVKRNIKHYNLDAVISLGYRVNSQKATKFRQWATSVLKNYIQHGYALNKEKLQQQKLAELNKTIQLIQQGLESKELSTQEAKGFAEIIGNYAKSWALLQGYDEQSLQEIAQTTEQRFILDLDEAKAAISELKTTLIAKGEATELFGQEKAGEFKGNLLNIYQSFGGEELLPSIEQKAANLLYYVTKGHPFNDGNKRIGAYLFVLFLHKNGVLYKSNGESKINDNALASLALLVATSAPEQKDIIIKLVMNMLYDGEV